MFNYYFEQCLINWDMMARRSDNTREEIKKMAIAAGLALLDQSGAEALSARKIATAIGYTVGTLYHVFTDFEDLVLHLNAATLSELHAQLLPLSAAKTKPLTRILNLAQCYGKFAQTYPARWNLLHHAPRSTPVPRWFQQEIAALFTLVEQPLRALPGVTPTVARHAAKTLWAGLHGICALSINQKLTRLEAAPLPRMIDQFIRVYIRGLTA